MGRRRKLINEYCSCCNLVVAPYDPDREGMDNGEIAHGRCLEIRGKLLQLHRHAGTSSLSERLRALGLSDAQIERLLARGARELDTVAYAKLVRAVQRIVGEEKHGAMHQKRVAPQLKREQLAQQERATRTFRPADLKGTMPPGMMPGPVLYV